MHSPYFYTLQRFRLPTFPDEGNKEFVRSDLWRLNRHIKHMEQWLEMAPTKKPTKQHFGNEITFVTIRLDKEQAAAFGVWQNTKSVDFELELADFMSKGWKTSITWDGNNDCYIVSSTCKDDRNVNLNTCVTSRSTSWYEAMLLNVYKVVILYKNGKLPTETTENNWG